jgi:chitin synthase
MQLLEMTTFQYLGHRGIPGVRQNMRGDDAQRFEQLKLALKNVGFSKCHVAQTCQLIAAILHLGDLEFTVDRDVTSMLPLFITRMFWPWSPNYWVSLHQH